MKKFKRRFLDKWLKEDGLVAVPESWQREYTTLCRDAVHRRDAVATLINEFNTLLEDYYLKHARRELIDEMEIAELPYKTNTSKEEMAKALTDHYSIVVEK